MDASLWNSKNISRASVLRAMAASTLIPLTGAALAGCGGSGGGSEDPESGAVVFNFYGDAEMQKNYDKLFGAFKSAHPNIKLTVQGIPADSWGDFLNIVATRLAGGQAIDVVQVATEGQQLFAARNLLEPLEPFMAQNQDEVDALYADCPPELLGWFKDYASPDGKTYYMPAGYNTMVLQVHEPTFAAAGLDTPDGGWTWEDFRTAGRTIKDKTGAFLIPVSNEYFQHVMPWLVNNGASTLSSDWKTATFSSPEAIEALTFARSLVVDGLAPEPGGTFDAPTQMANGALATFGGGRWPTNDLRRLGITDQVTLRRYPQNKQQGTVVGWEGWPILRGSKNKPAAWTFVRYLMSKEYSDAVTAGGITSVPARLSQATGEAFQQDAPSNQALLSETVNVATPVPSPIKGSECALICQEAWLQGVSGTKTPEVALSEANDKLQALLA